MSASARELRDAFRGVLSRAHAELEALPLFDERKTVNVCGMALPLGVSGSAPTRLLVFPLGEPASNDDRRWRFIKEDLAKAAEAFRARAEPLPILYDHGNDPAKGSKAAGWVDSVELASDGLYANVRWTDQARADIRSGEWAFRSPRWDGTEFEDGSLGAGPLTEISLVNLPAIAGMVPVTASSQPSLKPVPPETAGKETIMAETTTVTAAKTKAAAFDKAGILQLVRDSMGIPDVITDEVLAGLVTDALEGGVEDAPADPMMPGTTKPETPAVPLFTSAEDEAKVKAASATAPVKMEAAEEIKATLEAALVRIKTLESQQLSGQIVTANAADRKPATPEVPSAPDPHDHIGRSILAFKQDTVPAHKAAISYLEKARADGKRITYREAVVAVTRKTA